MERWARPFGLKASFPQGVLRPSGVFGKMTTLFTPAARASRTSRKRPVFLHGESRRKNAM